MHCCPGSSSPSHNDTCRSMHSSHTNRHKELDTHTHMHIREHEASSSARPLLSAAQSVFKVQSASRSAAEDERRWPLNYTCSLQRHFFYIPTCSDYFLITDANEKVFLVALGDKDCTQTCQKSPKNSYTCWVKGCSFRLVHRLFIKYQKIVKNASRFAWSWNHSVDCLMVSALVELSCVVPLGFPPERFDPHFPAH